MAAATFRTHMKRQGALALAFFLVISFAKSGDAFTHNVRQGETLASIAEQYYGRIEHEKILVAANALDAQGGSPIVPGMRLEIPAVSFHVITGGETWASLAQEYLGDAERAGVLATANDTVPWVPPVDGQEIVVPYNLRYLVGSGETLVTISQKFFGKREKAWTLDRYNRRKGEPVRRGDVVLIPFTDLALTEAGKIAAAASEANIRAQAEGQAREAQRKVDAEMPILLSDVRNGRYVDAVARGTRMLSAGELTNPQLASIHRQLLESYIALDSPELASASCASWIENDPDANWNDKVRLSPKIVDACAKVAPIAKEETDEADPEPESPAP